MKKILLLMIFITEIGSASELNSHNTNGYCGKYEMTDEEFKAKLILEITNAINATPQFPNGLLQGRITMMNASGKLYNYRITEGSMLKNYGKDIFKIKFIDPFERATGLAAGVIGYNNKIDLTFSDDFGRRKNFRGNRVQIRTCNMSNTEMLLKPTPSDECVLRCARMPNAWECIRNC